MATPRQRTEHAARIVPPGEFRSDAFRRKRIAAGVSLVLGKRPGARKTEVQSIRFDADRFSRAAAESWLTRHGYRAIAFDPANPIAPPASPAPNAPREISTVEWYTIAVVANGARDNAQAVVEHASKIATMARKTTAISPQELPIAVKRASSAFARLSRSMGDLERLAKTAGTNPTELHNRRPYRIELDEQERKSLDWIADRYGYADTLAARLVPLDDRPSSPGATVYGIREYEGWEFADAVDAEDGWLPLAGGELARKLGELYEAIRDERPATINPKWKRTRTRNPSEFTVPEPPFSPAAAEPNPRALVQIGLARELQLDTGTGWRWTIADDWRVLVPAGAEQLAPGAGRLFLVPPPSSTSSAPPEPSAAAATFAEWHGFDARRLYAHDVPLCEEFGAPVGRALRIVYRSDKWDRKHIDYDHTFKASDPPAVSILGTAEAPRAILVRGGVFRTTARGLVD
jgi:hypothetical protein